MSGKERTSSRNTEKTIPKDFLVNRIYLSERESELNSSQSLNNWEISIAFNHNREVKRQSS